MPKDVKGKTIVACSCGYKQQGSTEISVTEKVKIKEQVEMVVEGDDESRLPVLDAECGKCGHGKAYFWTKQTRAADEPETKFLKCVKCKHTWRDYN